MAVKTQTHLKSSTQTAAADKQTMQQKLFLLLQTNQGNTI